MSDKSVVETLNPHSVEISRGANGKISITVKAYASSVAEAASDAMKTFENLKSVYPDVEKK